MCGGIGPNGCIGLAIEPNLRDTHGTGKGFFEACHEPIAEVFVEEEFHAVGPELYTTEKSRATRMCCGVKVGKSAKSSASVIPPSKYSNTS